jgi:type IV/VI secretion system ImpK/VasF family protein
VSAASTGQLADLCAGVVRLALALDAERSLDADALAARFDRLFAELEQRAARAGVSEAPLRLALYALCAWIDERILLSDLPARRAWAANPLQLRRFDDLAAGDEFYARLESLRASAEPGAVDALEIYALCLALGFRGKLANAPVDRRRLLLEQLAAEIARSRCSSSVSILAPSPAEPLTPRAACWIAPLCAVAGLVLCCLLLRAWRDHAVDALVATVAEVTHGP